MDIEHFFVCHPKSSLRLEECNMALFEYRCKDCGKLSEHLVFNADETPACTTCGSVNMEKLLSTFAVNAKQSSSAGPMPGCPNAGCCGGSCGMA